jgi:purine-cytosine permease-like protein
MVESAVTEGRPQAETPVPPPEGGRAEVRRRIRALAESRRLSPAQRRIARYLIDHAEEAGFLTSVDLAQRVGVSQPSATRFAATDDSSYLPEDTSQARTSWWTAGGSVISTVWMMAFGAMAGAVTANAFNSRSVAFIRDLGFNGTRWLISAIIILGIIAVNVLNLYGMFMSTTRVTALRQFQIRSSLRAGFVLGAGVIGTAIAVAATSNLPSDFENFILFVACFLVPWTAVNLTDFYLVRHGRYHGPSIFTAKGSYGGVDWRTMVAYLVATAAEVPFINTTFYASPMVSGLGGGDNSWILGLNRPLLAAPPGHCGRPGPRHARGADRAGGASLARAQ